MLHPLSCTGAGMLASTIASLTPLRVQPFVVPPADTPTTTRPSSARALFPDQATFALELAQVQFSYLFKLYSIHNMLLLYVQPSTSP